MKKILLLCLGLLVSMTASALTPEPTPPASSLVTLTSSNTLVMNDYYNEDSVAQVIQKALKLDRALPATEPIYLVIHSGGGSIQAGLRLIQVLAQLKRPVHTISLFSASMGFETVQGLGDRLVSESGTLMSHRASGMFYGEFPSGNLATRYKFWTKRLLRKDLITVSRNPNLKSVGHYRKVIANEYWCEGAQCVRHGFADRVVRPQCDSSLEGTETKLIKTVMSGFPIVVKLVYSQCPLQPYILDWQLYYDGQPLWVEPTQKTDFIVRDLGTMFPDQQTVMAIIKEASALIDSLQSKKVKLTID